jgi:hypothetical protein
MVTSAPLSAAQWQLLALRCRPLPHSGRCRGCRRHGSSEDSVESDPEPGIGRNVSLSRTVSGSSGQSWKSTWWARGKGRSLSEAGQTGAAHHRMARRGYPRANREAGSMNRNRRPDWRRIKRKLSYTIGRKRWPGCPGHAREHSSPRNADRDRQAAVAEQPLEDRDDWASRVDSKASHSRR